MNIKEQYKSIVLSAIDNIHNKKVSDKIAPNYALRLEILKLITSGIDKVLDDLVESGELKTNDTMKGISYEHK